MKNKALVPHSKFKDFQKKYGAIPASDKNDHIIKSRMLQGIYRNEKTENAYCNYVYKNSSFINFMRNKRLEEDAFIELQSIKQRERLTDEKRLFENLLSSQPMAFNIFLPLRWNDYEVGTPVFKELFPFLNIEKITDIKLEYVKGDGKGKKDREITTDNSCFDVYVEYINDKQEKGSIGIEVKYTESFSQSDYRKEEGEKKERYIRAIDKYSQQFSVEDTDKYLSPKYNQLFRNQLLTEEVKGKFNINSILCILYSEEDKKCREIISEYLKIIKIENSCIPITISMIISVALKYSQQNTELNSLYEDIFNRYCNYKLLNEVIIDEKPNKKELPNPFIKDISLSDVPSSINWKEIFDFSQTFDLKIPHDLERTAEKTIYLKSYFNNYQQIDSDSIHELRAVLLNYINKKQLHREEYPTSEDLFFLGAIISKIHIIIYDKSWEEK